MILPRVAIIGVLVNLFVLSQQNFTDVGDMCMDSFFFVSRSDNGDTCVVGTSNPVTNDQATILSSTLTTLKKTPQSDLRGLKLNVLDQGARSSHGGGGMGLLDLTKISCGNINYEFLPWTQDKLLFCLTIQLHSTPD